MEDIEIVGLYLSRDECAIAQTEEKYGNYCNSIAVRILEDHHYAQEAVADTWLKAWNTIPPQRPTSLKMYLAKITRNISFSRLRQECALKRGGGEVMLALEELDECVGTMRSAEDCVSAKELTASIRWFLLQLPDRDRNIFIRRYFFVDSIESIAGQYGLKKSNIHMILTRVRKKLKNHLIQEGYVL